MKKLLISASLAASLVLPSAAAQAQAIPGAVIAVVDLEKVTSDCNACKTASAALRSQATALQSRQQASEELQRQQQQIEANSQYVQKQVSDKLGPIYSSVMQRRGANIMVEIGQTLASGATLDVTNDVLTALNSALPSIATTAPAAARTNQPQGR